MEFKPGLEWVLHKSPGTRVCCLAVRYEQLWESRPQIFLNAALLPAGSTAEDARARLEILMGQIDRDIQTQNFSSYETLMESGLSINKKWERFVCLLTGKPFTPKNT
ncbi:hypothetical protein [Geitlerinema calcuttense]|uniref:Uncharacterized protein n=1 Tax=Geitlerinema calcuttense NRMC-F 0142 TaxID=2922238 RepID=A0ABT7LX76_9CYAN|nr:hypothetical protein [Geitlerinema calcuttense]MDL5056616.1 hypothetical protein [Geitlerinema calcuttense NRMC-F 0142]